MQTDEIPDYTAAKREMIQKQLRRRGIHDRRVLEAMEKVPRERFVLEEYRSQAYADRALPIRCAQTISQPYIVALMTQALELSGGEKVLEVGTGSGYQTAILAELAGHVVSIERHAELSRQAAQVLKELGYQNVTLVHGDGTQGWPEQAPYDRVIVTAAAPCTPSALFEQLAEGGILVIPVGSSDYQILQAIRKRNGEPYPVSLCPCRFVPLVSMPGPGCP
ncbi:MAG TPA: protein-L-isoaspartate(D-aspartate) O-methyltransferase [Planctomycetaceae bacterium]|nr:protein-L-isoaspartate(D-aspartate) O-methyltransferase [Planctomycetaceae bacterium]